MAQRFMGNRESILEQIKDFALSSSEHLNKMHRRADRQQAKGSYSGGQKDDSTKSCGAGEQTQTGIIKT